MFMNSKQNNMKKRILFLALFIIVAMSVIMVLSFRQVSILRGTVEKYKTNTSILMQDVERYRTSDSMNAVKAGVLTLKLSEIEKLRADDMRTIEMLKVKKKQLEEITTMQMQMMADIKGVVKDSIIYRDRIIRDTIKTLDVSDEWIDLHGVIYKDGAFDGTLEVRDSLIIVETVKRARFLGFLWRTKRVKSREVDVVNKNPYSQIVGLESIKIEQ